MIFVGNCKSYWSTSGFSFKYSRKKSDLIFLLSLGYNGGLAWLSTLHFGIYRFKIQKKSSRTAVYNPPYCGSVRFPKGGKFKNVSEGISSHCISLNKCKLSDGIIQK